MALPIFASRCWDITSYDSKSKDVDFQLGLNIQNLVKIISKPSFALQKLVVGFNLN